jgi:pyridoxal phosphate enzyme (YggS family)
MNNTISGNLQEVKKRIILAEQAFGRKAKEVKLIVVSKGRSAEEIKTACLAGQLAFGESYVQEAITKITVLQDLQLEWHFIGPMQSNKTRTIAENFAWVHSVDRFKLAERLSQQRPLALPPLNICLEINVSEESSKSGVSFDQLSELATAVVKLPKLKLRGLMAIPEYTDDFARQRANFKKVAAAQSDLMVKGFELDTLSMGMSHDFVAAIAEGATMVRIGSAIF